MGDNWETNDDEGEEEAAASEKVTDTTYFFCRNRDLGTISAYVGYFYVHSVPPLYVYIVQVYILYPIINTPYPQRG